MDSKELLELLTTFLKPTVWKDGFEIRNLKTGEAKTMDEILDNVYSDLEALKILKKYIYYSPKSHCIKMREIRKTTSNFNYEDLKEWMENGN